MVEWKDYTAVCLPEGASVHTLSHRARLASQISMNLYKEGQNLNHTIQTAMAVHASGHACVYTEFYIATSIS